MKSAAIKKAAVVRTRQPSLHWQQRQRHHHASSPALCSWCRCPHHWPARMVAPFVMLAVICARVLTGRICLVWFATEGAAWEVRKKMRESLGCDEGKIGAMRQHALPRSGAARPPHRERRLRRCRDAQVCGVCQKIWVYIGCEREGAVKFVVCGGHHQLLATSAARQEERALPYQANVPNARARRLGHTVGDEHRGDASAVAVEAGGVDVGAGAGGERRLGAARGRGRRVGAVDVARDLMVRAQLWVEAGAGGRQCVRDAAAAAADRPTEKRHVAAAQRPLLSACLPSFGLTAHAHPLSTRI